MVTRFFRLHFHKKTNTLGLNKPKTQITILQTISSIIQSNLSYMHKLGNSSISDRIMIYQKIGKTTRQWQGKTASNLRNKSTHKLTILNIHTYITKFWILNASMQCIYIKVDSTHQKRHTTRMITKWTPCSRNFIL